MAITHEHIIEGCLHVLENVGFHITSERRERRFLTGYQIYTILEREENPLCQELIIEVNGDFIGEGAHHHDGGYDGQAKRIAQALGRNPNIETQYIDTRHLKIDDIEPSSKEDCGIFRLRN